MGSTDRAVLIIGQHGEGIADLTERVRGVGYRALRIKTAEEALDLAQERRIGAEAILIEPELAAFDLPGALTTLRGRLAEGRPDAIIAAGERPDLETLKSLRRAGVTLALWEPCGNHVLRFQINRASTEQRLLSLRQEQRLPTEWRTRLHVAGRKKPADIYSLSGGGAYLATPRPSQRGAEIAIELPLPSGVVSVAGRVLYTNVPGNLQRPTLPDGMGIEFVALPAEIRRTIRDEVELGVARYHI